MYIVMYTMLHYPSPQKKGFQLIEIRKEIF